MSAADDPRVPTARSLLWPRRPSAYLGVLAAVASAVSRVAVVPLFVTPLFDRALADPSALPGMLLVAGAVVLGGSLALWAQDALLGRAAALSTADARRAVYSDLLHRPPGTLPGSSGALASRVITDLKEVENYVRYGLGSLVAESVTLGLILGALVRADVRAAGLLAALGLPAALALRGLGAALQRAAAGSMEGTEALGRHIQEGVRHHETVAAFGARRFMLRRFDAVNRSTAAAGARRSLLAGLQVPVTQVLLYGALGAVVVVLAGGVRRGELTVGEMVSFLTLVALAAGPAQLLPAAYALYRQAAAAARRVEALARERQPAEGAPSDATRPSGADAGRAAEPAGPTAPGPEVGSAADASGPARPVPTPAPGAAGHALSLRGLATGFDAERPVLTGLDLDLPPRGLFAVTGPSGVGKTTLLRTLLGLLPPVAGRVVWGDRELRDVPDEELRRLVAYVPQGHELVSGTVREALALGREVADDDLWAALEAAGVARTVADLPGGLDAELGEDGSGLSGGQRQRLAIARALVGRPAALLLDEPTSNLDEAAEAGVVELLARLGRERLVLAVSHRPALAAAADAVIELGPADGAGRTLAARGAASERA
ncbi:MAG TPA: ABC transporter ATP-binding protein [Trueperaceae bacterium]